MQDRLKASLFALVRAATPRSEYGCLYFGRVVAQSDDLRTVDIVPNDARLPSMSLVPLRGEPGVLTDLRDSRGHVPEGVSVLIGWENSDPSLHFACLWSGAGVVTKKTISASELNLGGGEGAEPTVMGTTYRAAESDLHAQFVATLTSLAGASTGPLAPLAAGFTAMATAIQQLEAKQATFLSTNARVK